MFTPDQLNPIFDRFQEDMREINEEHQKRLRKIQRRSNLGRAVALGIVFVGAAIAANQATK